MEGEANTRPGRGLAESAGLESRPTQDAAAIRPQILEKTLEKVSIRIRTLIFGPAGPTPQPGVGCPGDRAFTVISTATEQSNPNRYALEAIDEAPRELKLRGAPPFLLLAMCEKESVGRKETRIGAGDVAEATRDFKLLVQKWTTYLSFCRGLERRGGTLARSGLQGGFKPARPDSGGFPALSP